MVVQIHTLPATLRTVWYIVLLAMQNVNWSLVNVSGKVSVIWYTHIRTVDYTSVGILLEFNSQSDLEYIKLHQWYGVQG